MATLLDLVLTGRLFKLDPMLGPRDQEFRSIYLTPRAAKWIEETLPTLESTWNVEESPAEQLDALAEIFCAGRPLTFDLHFKPLTPIRHGVWELKTADLRLFGWFHQKDCFVVDAADSTDRIKDRGLYAGYVTQTARFRDTLDLDQPKFVPGNNPHDVCSDFSFP